MPSHTLEDRIRQFAGGTPTPVIPAPELALDDRIRQLAGQQPDDEVSLEERIRQFAATTPPVAPEPRIGATPQPEALQRFGPPGAPTVQPKGVLPPLFSTPAAPGVEPGIPGEGIERLPAGEQLRRALLPLEPLAIPARTAREGLIQMGQDFLSPGGPGVPTGQQTALQEAAGAFRERTGRDPTFLEFRQLSEQVTPLPFGVRGAIEIAADPLNVVPGVGFIGGARKAGAPLGRLGPKLAGPAPSRLPSSVRGPAPSARAGISPLSLEDRIRRRAPPPVGSTADIPRRSFEELRKELTPKVNALEQQELALTDVRTKLEIQGATFNEQGRIISPPPRASNATLNDVGLYNDLKADVGFKRVSVNALERELEGLMPRQGQRFSESPTAVVREPLIDAEQAAARAGRQEEIARGQVELPETITRPTDPLEQARLELDEARALLEGEQTRGPAAPKFGTAERATFDAERRTAAAEGRRIIPKVQRVRQARERVREAQDQIRRVEAEEADALDQAFLRRDDPATVARREVGAVLEDTPPGVAPRVNDAPTGQVKSAPFERDPRMGPAPAGRELISVGDELAGTPQPLGAGEGFSPRAARAELDSALYDAILDSPIDVAATRYFRNGDFNQYIRDIPPEIPISPGFASHEFQHVGRVNARSLDPTRLLQTIDGGIFNGPLQKYVLWPTRRMFVASMRFGDTERGVFNTSLDAFGMRGFRSKQARELSGDVLEHIAREDSRRPLTELMARSEIRRIVSGRNAREQERIVGFAQDVRRILDELLEQQNLARTKRGQGPIPFLPNYKPWVIETNLWSRLGFQKKLPADVMERPPTPDFIRPDAPFNPRAEARTQGLKDYPRIRDLRRLMDDYIDTATRDIFFTDIIRNAKAHTKSLRETGFDVPAAEIDDWIAESFAGTQTPFTKFVRDFVPREGVEGLLFVRRSLTRAVFPLNWTWNLGVQTSSMVPTFSRYGPINTLRGMDYIFQPSARRWTRRNAYSTIVKRRQGGKISQQGAGFENTAEMSARLDQSPLDTAVDIANFLTNVIEDNLTGISVRAAYHNGRGRGLTGRALIEWASEGGSKTQSMYNIHDRPGALRSQELQAIAPFQTFAFEMFNTFREMFSPVGRVGAFRSTAGSPTERMRQLIVFIGGMYAVNVAGEAYLNRKPWVVGSFLPFYGLLVGGMNPGSPLGEPLPRQYQEDFWKGTRDIIRRGDWNRFRRWVVRYHVPAGTQANRTIEGLLAVSRGGVSDTAGRELFEVSPDEWFTAVTRGPYSTEEGKEWIKKQRGKRGPFSDILGFEVPTPVQEKKKGPRITPGITFR